VGVGARVDEDTGDGLVVYKCFGGEVLSVGGEDRIIGQIYLKVWEFFTLQCKILDIASEDCL
jgi:hypothetical protein